jgi:site-specific DNA-methyltransferase (adenine-specific)
MKRIPDGFVDLIITDPPYGMEYSSRSKKMKDRKVRGDKWNESLQNLLREYYKECARILKVNGAIYSFCSHHHIEFFKRQIAKNFEYRDTLIWRKNNHTLTDFSTRYASIYEMILYGAKDSHTLRSTFQRNVLDFDTVPRKDLLRLDHPTPKPVELLVHLIKNSSDPDDIVFYGFVGCGSTAVAALETHRYFLVSEIERKHYRTTIRELDAIDPEWRETWNRFDFDMGIPEELDIDIVGTTEWDLFTLSKTDPSIFPWHIRKALGVL